MFKRTSIVPANDSLDISKDTDSIKENEEEYEKQAPLSPIYTAWGDIFKHWPLTTFCIVSNEFCERFSYYGMRTVLTLYLLNILKMSYNTSTIFFNGFTVLCYFTPLLGSILADGYIGKFRTIFFVSILYTIGQVILAVSSIFNSSSSLHPWLDYLGLVIIGFGTGGIKPCVNSFGGEQFEQHQERMLSLFFSMFYFSINAGSMISTFISPIFRSLPCLGQDTCFPLAFGVPAILMIVATVIFMAGSFKYKKPVVKNNVFGEVWRVCKQSMKNKYCKTPKTKKDHWLDHYFTTHDCSKDDKCLELQKTKRDSSLCQKREFVDDIKQLFRVAIMFLPVPIFWALYDQQGSIWLIQSIQMDCRVGSLLILPDQMQTLNAVLILIFIPLFQVVVYPAIELCFKMTPLRKMVLGGLLATLAFVVSGLIQLEVNKTLPTIPQENQAFVDFFNTLDNCNISITPIDKAILQNLKNPLMTTKDMSKTLVDTQFEIPSGSFKFKVEATGNGCSKKIPSVYQGKFDSESINYVVFNNNGAYQRKVDPSKPTEGEGEFSMAIDIALNENYTASNVTNLALCKLDVDKFDSQYPCDPNQSGSEFYYWERDYNGNTDDMTPISYESSEDTSIVASSYVYKPVKPGKWGLYYMYNQPKDISHQTYSKQKVKVEATNITFEVHAQGGVYNLIVTGDKQKPNGRMYQFVKDNTVNILWQVPQYVIITAAEICFSVTGLEFAYSQAAPSMKALVQAMWLLTTAIGDTIIVIVAAANIFDDMAVEFMAYGGLMLVVIIVFALMSQFYYEYKNYGEEENSSIKSKDDEISQ